MSSEVLAGVCGIVDCGELQCLVAHTNYGLSFDDDGTADSHGNINVIRVDAALRGQDYIETLLHEWGHHRHPDWTEEQIEQFGEQLKEILFLPEVMRRAGWDYDRNNTNRGNSELTYETMEKLLQKYFESGESEDLPGSPSLPETSSDSSSS